MLGEHSGPVGVPMLDNTAMATLRSSFLAAAIERGFVHQCTDLETLDERLRNGRASPAISATIAPPTACTSAALVRIMLLRLFQSVVTSR
jgi:tyrosyl-tRNA synthetase